MSTEHSVDPLTIRALERERRAAELREAARAASAARLAAEQARQQGGAP